MPPSRRARHAVSVEERHVAGALAQGVSGSSAHRLRVRGDGAPAGESVDIMASAGVAEVTAEHISGAWQRTDIGRDARALASGVLRHAEACWRGDAGARHFTTRLGAYWSTQLPPRPRRTCDAFSPHGAGGRGIHWYQTDGAVIGYIPGCTAGYHVPREAVARLVRCA